VPWRSKHPLSIWPRIGRSGENLLLPYTPPGVKDDDDDDNVVLVLETSSVYKCNLKSSSRGRINTAVTFT
jgi:hypothetical protein